MKQPSQLLAYSLKTLDWSSAQQLQRYFSQMLPTMEDIGAVLILCEHPPMISTGREIHWRAKSAVQQNQQYCGRYGAEIYHTQGQLNAYYISHTSRWTNSPFQYRHHLQNWLMKVMDTQRVTAQFETRADILSSRTGELGYLTGQFRHQYSQFGWSLNVNSTGEVEKRMSGWQQGNQVTSVSRELCKPVRCSSIREAAISTLMDLESFSSCQFHSTHPYLSRQRQPHQTTPAFVRSVVDYR